MNAPTTVSGDSVAAPLQVTLTKDGKIYVLEANPNPQIAQDEDFAESAKRAGLPYDQIIQQIITLGLQWRPERQG